MSKKTSNAKLLIILVILLAAIGIVKYMDSRKGERNFRSELVDIDTSKVTAIHVYPKSKDHKRVKLFKEGDDWKVQVSDQRSVRINEGRISEVLNQLLALKPKRLAARTSSRWGDFQVDSAATRVEVYEGDKKTLDLILGKFSFQQTSNNMETFVRLAGKPETYTVDGFLNPTFDNGPDHWRDKTVIKGSKDEWVGLSYTLPAFGSYQLQLQDSVWKVGNEVADQTEVDNYLNTITNITGSTFADNIDAAALGTPDYVLQITNQQGDEISVKGFVKDDGTRVLKSSLNPENLFAVKEGPDNLFETVFVGKPKFFPEERPDDEIKFTVE